MKGLVYRCKVSVCFDTLENLIQTLKLWFSVVFLSTFKQRGLAGICMASCLHMLDRDQKLQPALTASDPHQLSEEPIFSSLIIQTGTSPKPESFIFILYFFLLLPPSTISRILSPLHFKCGRWSRRSVSELEKHVDASANFTLNEPGSSFFFFFKKGLGVERLRTFLITLKDIQPAKPANMSVVSPCSKS